MVSKSGLTVAAGNLGGDLTVWRSAFHFLDVTGENGSMELCWIHGTLQTADKVSGEWHDLLGTASPFLVDKASALEISAKEQ